MPPLRASAALIVLLSAATSAHAQEKGDWGLTMGYPSAAGLIWHGSDRLALRPDLTFSGSTSKAEALGITGTSGYSTSVGVGISLLYYLRQWDGLRTYVCPRFSYSRATSSVESLAGPGLITDLTISGYSGSGLFGAQYSLHRRFSVFAEVGFGFTDQTSSSSAGSTARTDSIGWGTRTGIGAAFYF